jgi:hypothetical protein
LGFVLFFFFHTISFDVKRNGVPKKTSPNNFSLNLLTAHWVKYYAEYKSVRNSEFFIKNSSNILRNPAHTICGAKLRKIIRA